MDEKNQNKDNEIYDLLYDYFSRLKRQGPGSREVTERALGFITDLPAYPAIADIGCGTGGQTITLADCTPGHISAVDLSPRFIDIVNERASEHNLQDRITGIVGSMDNLPFDKEEFDLIWSEGAIYNIGFRKGLELWKQFLRPGGYIAVTDASWLKKDRPPVIEEFWSSEYPEMKTISSSVKQMEETGYVPIATFILPDTCWTENYYIPQITVREEFLKAHPGNSDAVALAESEKKEADLYDRYKQYYGYVFYIGKKI